MQFGDITPTISGTSRGYETISLFYLLTLPGMPQLVPEHPGVHQFPCIGILKYHLCAGDRCNMHPECSNSNHTCFANFRVAATTALASCLLCSRNHSPNQTPFVQPQLSSSAPPFVQLQL